MTPAIELRDVTKRFATPKGGVYTALRGLDMQVMPGEFAAVVGPTGCGKSTTLALISGLEPPKIVSAGIGLSPEGRRVFPALSVLTNLRLGAWTRKAAGKKSLDETLERVFGYFPRLEERKDQLAGTMSGGEQQMLAIGRAVMSKPRVLLIDEASLGLSPKLAQTVFQVVSQINHDGTTVVIVEQNVGVLPYADQALIMEKGTITYDGLGSDLEKSGDLRKTYLGEAS